MKVATERISTLKRARGGLDIDKKDVFLCVFEITEGRRKKAFALPKYVTVLSMIVAISDFLGPREKVSCLDTTTGEFEYRLLNRCLVTNSFFSAKYVLYHLRRFFFCGNMSESLENFLFLLTIVRISGLRL